MFRLQKQHIDIRLLLRLTLPIFLELVLQLLVGNVDKIMVGNDYSATAINQANTILDMLAVSLSVLSAASLILISQYKGAHNKEKEQQVYVLSFYFNLTVSLSIGVLLAVLARPVLSAIHVQPEIMDEAVIYLRITGSGLFLQAVMLSLSAYLRSNTYMKQCLFVAFLFNIINISGNALFLWGFGMQGAVAVAIPSVISRLMGALILFYEVRKYLRLNLSITQLFRCRRSELLKILKIGLPSCGESISYSFSQIVILAIITRSAPWKRGENLRHHARHVLVPVHFGHFPGHADSARPGARRQTPSGSRRTRGLGDRGLLRGVHHHFRRHRAVREHHFRPADRQCRRHSPLPHRHAHRYCAGNRPRHHIVMVRALQTCGDVIFPTTLAIIFCWAVAVCGSWLLGSVLGLGIIGVWVAMSADELCRAGIFIVRFRRGNWKNLSLVDEKS